MSAVAAAKAPAKKKLKRPKLPEEYEVAIKTHVDRIIDENDVVMFCINTCPHCDKSEATFKKNNVGVTKINLNTYSYQCGEYEILGPLMHKYVKQKTGIKTVPNIIVKNDMIGGNKQLNQSIETG